ncbi:energy-coupling factor transporter ATP-binding protein EcfA2 [Sphingomonas sp. UYAg733]
MPGYSSAHRTSEEHFGARRAGPLSALIRFVFTSMAGGRGAQRRIPGLIDDTTLPVRAGNGEDAAAPLAMGAASQAQRVLRRGAIFSAFNAALPVTDRHGLAGRNTELDRLIEAVVRQHKHAIIFGARGSGKTSLVRVFGDLADEAGCIALYASASSDASFEDLFRPFLAELPMGNSGRAHADRLGASGFDVPQFANLLVAEIRPRTLLIIDEFDRIGSDKVKQDVAALLKLLTDILSPVQIVLVGIASDVEGLIAAHPSLRRHLMAQQVKPIAGVELAALLHACADQVGLSISDAAMDSIVTAAMGSPYHARLFGMHAALAADAAGQDEVTEPDAAAGLANSMSEWADVAGNTYEVFSNALDMDDDGRRMVALAGIVAAQLSVVSVDRLAAIGADLFGSEDMARQAAADALARLKTTLGEMPGGRDYQFEDSLAPQFLVLMAKNAATRPSAGASNRSAEMRSLLQGVAGI